MKQYMKRIRNSRTTEELKTIYKLFRYDFINNMITAKEYHTLRVLWLQKCQEIVNG